MANKLPTPQTKFIAPQTSSSYTVVYRGKAAAVMVRHVEDDKFRVRIQGSSTTVLKGIVDNLKNKSVWADLKEDHYSVLVPKAALSKALADAVQATASYHIKSGAF